MLNHNFSPLITILDLRNKNYTEIGSVEIASQKGGNGEIPDRTPAFDGTGQDAHCDKTGQALWTVQTGLPEPGIGQVGT